MWLERSKSRARGYSASPAKFACSSFKDIDSLISDEERSGDAFASQKKPSICHRIRSVKSFLRIAAGPSFLPAEEIRIQGAEKVVVVYFTSLRVVRRTFEDCKAVRSILSAFSVPIDERDLSMDSRFIEELRRILGLAKMTLPRVFIGGRYIGGVEDVRRLHESGDLSSYVEGLPIAERGTCEVCGGYRFVLCLECSGSHKCYSDKAGFSSCRMCNENGLIRCPSCSHLPSLSSL